MTDIAVVGMACLFPGAPDLATFAANLRAGVDAIGDVPAVRWDASFHRADAIYTRRGGFVDEHAWFDAAAHGIMPLAAAAAEPDQLLALDVAVRAFRDVGLGDSQLDRRRAGVILGRGGYPGPARTRLMDSVRGAEQLARMLRQLGKSEREIAELLAEYRAALGAAKKEAVIGLVPNLAASRIAHRLDLGGPAWTVDAACASALVAVDQAVTSLRARKLDLVLAGGAHFCHDEAFWSVFAELGALSRGGTIRPFDRRADGILIGEGAGVVALMRRADADAAGVHTYALVRGTGVSSDGRAASLMSPAVEGQVAALTAAWRDAELDPSTVGLIEAHGTATTAGDNAELETVARVFGGESTAALGSVKSMIGHAMPAAGAAGMIKAVLALHEKTIFPSLHCDEPAPALAKTRHRVPATAMPWDGPSPRRAGVNAFGFGGVNAHVVLEESAGGAATRVQIAMPGAAKVSFYAGADAAGLLAALGGARVASGAWRLAIVDATPERIAKARGIVEKTAGKSAAEVRPWRGRDGIFFSTQGLLANGTAGVAFVFPGVDATNAGGAGLEEHGATLVEKGQRIGRALAERGVKPALAVGHSIGEWTAMVAAGMVGDDEVVSFAARARRDALEVPGVAFAALGAGIARAEGLLDGLADIAVSHDNCPHQVILCGVDGSIDEAMKRARAAGILGQKLPFRSGFHSPLFAPHIGPHRDNFAGLHLHRAQFPVWSATICAPYPDEPSAIRALALRHLVEPVHFRELIARVHAGGVRVFVQLGAGSANGFIEDTLRGEPHAAIVAGSVEDLDRVMALLWSEGFQGPNQAAMMPEVKGRPVRLVLGVPLVDLKIAPSAPANQSVDMLGAPGSLAGTYSTLLADIHAASSDVLARLSVPAARQVTRRISVETHPWLMDHAFFPQPAGWTVVSDRHPVVPMTTTIQFLIDEASALMPGKVAVGIEEVRAFRWLAASTPVDVVFELTPRGPDRVHAVAKGYAEATVVFAHTYASANPPAPPSGGRPAAIDAVMLYRDRWMFHGPAFQGVCAIGAVRDDGLDGEIEVGAAPGALLDNAGQLFGLWVMLTTTQDRLAMPIGLERMSFHAPTPPTGARVHCDVRIRLIDARRVVADLSLSHAGHLWCQINGWEDRRFESDDRLWDALIHPERSILAQPVGPAFVYRDIYRAAPTREQLYRRFLGAAERAEHDAQQPRRQRAWLASRIALKDAARDFLWKAGHGPLYPVEIGLTFSESGRPILTVPGKRDLRASIAQKDDVTLAMVAEGREVGVGLEAIVPRPADVVATFTSSELALISSGDDRDEWLARFLAARQAARAQQNPSAAGEADDPRRWSIADRAGERVLCRGQLIETRRLGAHVMAWTI